MAKSNLVLIFTFLASASFAQQIPLYKKVPNSRPAVNKESTAQNGDILLFKNVSVPTLTSYIAPKPNGRAVIICPGGGYEVLAWDLEGTRVAAELNKIGISAFVLKYRLPNDSTCINRSLAPLQDAQQAIRIVRTNAKTFKIDPDKIGIMGFSAGGHLAATTSTHFNFKADKDNNDTISVRPDFSILIYPVISFDDAITHAGSKENLIGQHPRDSVTRFFSNELQVMGTTPPTFIVHAGDDDLVPVENSVRYYEACIKNKVPVEMHLYPSGGHGFGMVNRTTSEAWMDRLINWLATLR